MEEKAEETVEKYPYEKSLRKLLSDYIWTHKIQRSELDIELRQQKKIKIGRGVLYCLSTSGVIAGVCFNSQLTTLISAVVTFGISVFDMLLKEEDYAVKIGKLQSVSQELFHDKNELAFEIVKCEQGKYTEEEIEAIYKDYLNRYQCSCKSKIPESDKAIKLAASKLKIRKDEEPNNEFVDQELNR